MNSFGPADWKQIRLVAFDVDGTLYRQRPVRLRMARELVFHAIRQRSVEAIVVLKAYREIRERLADAGTADFEPELLHRTAHATGRTAAVVQGVVSEWMHSRALPHLLEARCAGVRELFAGLKRHGKTIGIVSDYPAAAKLAAMDLQAEFVVSANDRDVGILKPHPLGLERLMERAGASPDSTVLIGDRCDRDGLAARNAGVRCLIRSPQPRSAWQTFQRFDDPVFGPMLQGQ